MYPTSSANAMTAFARHSSASCIYSSTCTTLLPELLWMTKPLLSLLLFPINRLTKWMCQVDNFELSTAFFGIPPPDAVILMCPSRGERMKESDSSILRALNSTSGGSDKNDLPWMSVKLSCLIDDLFNSVQQWRWNWQWSCCSFSGSCNILFYTVNGSSVNIFTSFQ